MEILEIVLNGGFVLDEGIPCVINKIIWLSNSYSSTSQLCDTWKGVNDVISTAHRGVTEFKIVHVNYLQLRT